MRPLWFVVLAGCQFNHGSLMSGDASDVGVADDAPVDVEPDAFDPLCFGRASFTVCLADMPTTDLVLPVNTNINTTMSSAGKCNTDGAVIRTINGTDVCVVAGNTITTTSALGSFGTLPLVFVAVDSITINGLFDATATNGGVGGPGMNPALCAPTTVQGGADQNTGGGGGAGGSFGTKGGDGGAGAAGIAAAGAALAATLPGTTLRGGCKGAPGGLGTGAIRASGGDGGGAIYLVARNTITITGTISASAGGGLGGSLAGGGAGGGSGGMIVLAAPTLVIDASSRIVANGGGGGAGGGATDGGPGANAGTSMTAVSGGAAADVTATGGGNGGAAAANGGSSTQATAGGGGGGGGVGVIRVFTTQAPSAANFSPPPS